MSEVDCGYWVNVQDDQTVTRDVPGAALHTMSDVEADAVLVRVCAERMADKLALSRAKGRGGWHTPNCSDEHLLNLLKGHIEKGDMVDVLNLAGMILVRQESVSTMGPTLMLGPTGGVGTKAEKIKNMLETYNWTSQNAPCDGDSGVLQSASCVNGVRED